MISKILLIGSSILMMASCSGPAQISTEPMPTLTPSETQIISSTPTPPESLEELIVFVGHNEQTTSIGLMTSDGQNVRYVTDDTGNELLPKWSPDGQYLAYLSDRQVPLDEYNQQFYNLWLLGLSDEQPIRLTDEGQVSTYLTSFAWSPNNDKIIYQASLAVGIKVVDLTDLSTNTLGNYLRVPFDWSVKDELALADSYIHPTAFSLAILNSDYTPVLPPEDGFVAGGQYPLNTAHSIAWSPDGENLAVGSYAAGRGDSDLAIISIVEDKVVRQASLVERFNLIKGNEVTDVAWSPDGTMIAFRFSNRNDIIKEPKDDDIEQIYVTNSELTEMLAVTPKNMLCKYPQWSPDSTQMVFACQGEGEGNSDIWLVNKDGSDLRQLTNTPTYEGQPMWQP